METLVHRSSIVSAVSRAEGGGAGSGTSASAVTVAGMSLGEEGAEGGCWSIMSQVPVEELRDMSW